MIKTKPVWFHPHSLIKTIIYVNVFVFAASLVLSGRNIELSMNPFTALSPSIKTLIFLGASGTVPIDHYQEWWSLIAASWLHGGLLHILFNMTALFQIGPFVAREFGTHRMFLIYTLSGAAGFYLSYMAGVMVTIGASASLCGLIGATLFYGKSRGGIYGEAIFKQTSGWVFGLVLFGLLVPNINNWGHGGGLFAGIALAWLLGYNERSKENQVHRFCSIFFMGLTAVIIAWAFFSALTIAF